MSKKDKIIETIEVEDASLLPELLDRLGAVLR